MEESPWNFFCVVRLPVFSITHNHAVHSSSCPQTPTYLVLPVGQYRTSRRASGIKKTKSAGEPTQADIDKYHDLFVAELRRIFDKYKGPYGWGEKELIIK